MELIRKMHGEFKELLQMAEKGDYIILFEKNYQRLIPRKNDIFIQEGNKIWLNGTDLIYEGEFDWWDIDKNGNILIQQENKILLNGTDLIYEGEFETWSSYKDGIIFLTKENKLVYNNDIIYYFNETSFYQWDVCGNDNFIILKDNEVLLNGSNHLCNIKDSDKIIPNYFDSNVIVKTEENKFLINGTELVFEYLEDKGYINSFDICLDGIILEVNSETRLYKL